jgi:IS5 family transposase
VAVNKLLIQHGLMLKTGTVIDAALMAAPTSSKKDNQWHFGM